MEAHGHEEAAVSKLAEAAQRSFPEPAAADLPRQVPPASSIAALVTLGIVNTGAPYLLFYLLIDEAGAATASVITHVMPVVALFPGVGLLGERLTAGAIAGLILIALGAWLATSRHTPGEVIASMGRPRTPRRRPASEGRRRGSGIRSWPRRMTSTRAPGTSRPTARRASAGMVMVPLRGRTAILVSK
jgi:hypothetical protein